MSISKPLRVAMYLRVSTADQRLDLQRRDLCAYVDARGWTATEFVDEGVSGRKDRRPGLDAMMGEVRRRRVDVVLVWRFDRFARSVRHLVNALDEFRQIGVAFVSHQEAIDTSGGGLNQVLLVLVAAMAQLEVDLLRERTVAGLAAARARGSYVGGKRKQIDVAAIRRRLAAGESKRAIARELGISPGSIINRLREEASP